MRGLILFVVLAGCGMPEPEVVSNEAPVMTPLDRAQLVDCDQDLCPYLFEVVTRCAYLTEVRRDTCYKNLNHLVSIKYATEPVKEGILGVCSISTIRTIQITPNALVVDSMRIRDTLWHELGHCLLDYDHMDDGDIHVMNAAIVSEEAISLNWHYLSADFLDGKQNLIDFNASLWLDDVVYE